MEDRIETAFGRIQSFNGWRYANEAEFKHELFHCLAQERWRDTPLSSCEPYRISPRLHAEGKVENGNPAKADLLLCNPEVHQDFNFVVDHIIELKVSLDRKELKKELDKLSTYKGRFEGFWIAASSRIAVPEEVRELQLPQAQKLRIVGPVQPQATSVIQTRGASGFSRQAAFEIAVDCITDCLTLYGNGKSQYRSFYWCNFEHELERGHSFPCEGDFNAQLYHRLRLRLPIGIRIHSEYKPAKLSRRRIDLVLEGPGNRWAIPIEVKMNWDQFKPKYKNRVPARAEALTIVDRFIALKHEFQEVSPILVVIQGDWRRETKMRNMENARRDLDSAPICFELMCFHESKHRLGQYTVGHGRRI